MITELYVIGSGDDGEALRRGGQLIREGNLVVFPTETVYGLGASAYLSESAMKVYAAKGRPSDNPLIVHVEKPEDAEEFAYTSPLYYALAERFMPGPLTVILPKKDKIPPQVTGGLDTVAVRCPSNPTARALIREAAVPIAAPSANLSGKPSPTCARHVMQDMDGRVSMVIDGGDCDIGLESTVVSLADGCVKVLRPGAITVQMISDMGIPVTVDAGVTDLSAVSAHPESPGMKYKHYAPKASLFLVEGGTEELLAQARASKVRSEGKNIAVMCRSDEASLFDGFTVLDTGLSSKELAHRMFYLLRYADELCVSEIYAHLPSAEGESLAIYNRIIRSSGGNIIRKGK